MFCRVPLLHNVWVAVQSFVFHSYFENSLTVLRSAIPFCSIKVAMGAVLLGQTKHHLLPLHIQSFWSVKDCEAFIVKRLLHNPCHQQVKKWCDILHSILLELGLYLLLVFTSLVRFTCPSLAFPRLCIYSITVFRTAHYKLLMNTICSMFFIAVWNCWIDINCSMLCYPFL